MIPLFNVYLTGDMRYVIARENPSKRQHLSSSELFLITALITQLIINKQTDFIAHERSYSRLNP